MAVAVQIREAHIAAAGDGDTVQLASDSWLFERVDIPDGADLENTGLAISLKDKSGTDLVVFALHDYDMRFKTTGINEVNFKFKAFLNNGEYTLTVGLEHRESLPIGYFDYVEGAAYIKILTDREYFGVLLEPADIALG